MISPKQNMEDIAKTEFIHIWAYDVSLGGQIDLQAFSIAIDDQPLNVTVTASAIPHLFYAPWTPTCYGAGLHSISVTYSNHHHAATVSQSFLTSHQTAATIASANATLSYMNVFTATNPGALAGGLFLKTTLVPIIITVSYTGSILLAVLVMIARLTIRQAFPYPLDSSFDCRMRVWRFFEHAKDLRIPSVVRSVLLMASDRYVASFLIVAPLWMAFGFWSIGRFPDEFGIQTLWGMIFLPATSTGHYSLWLDLYQVAILYLFGFFVPLFAYYCAVMAPSTAKWLRTLVTVVGFVHFVGVYLVFKLYMLHGNIPVTALLLSPVHLWMEIVNVGLLIREVACGVWCKDAKDKYVNYESFDTIAVANSTWSVCNKHAKYHYRPSSVKY